MIDDDLIELARKAGYSLKQKHYKLAVAESCTGGLLAAAVTAMPGSSAWFDRGFVTYSNQAKMELLQVRPETLAEFGAVSPETAREMAAGTLANSSADWVIAVTGIAGPDGGSPDKPVGTVYIAWQNKDDFFNLEKCQLSGNRQEIRQQTVIIALSKLLTYFDN
jgi:nicotinamide-nucleotide amidase